MYIMQKKLSKNCQMKKAMQCDNFIIYKLFTITVRNNFRMQCSVAEVIATLVSLSSGTW